MNKTAVQIIQDLQVEIHEIVLEKCLTLHQPCDVVYVVYYRGWRNVFENTVDFAPESLEQSEP